MSGDRTTAEPAMGSRDVLDQDVGCPGCGYNLRGLAQDVAACPECGLVSDVAKLLTRRWDKPWYRAPKFNRLCLPAAVALISVLLLILSSIIAGPGASLIAVTLVGMLCLAAWSLLLVWVWRSMDGLTSFGFALLAHLPLLGYIVGIVFLISGIITTAVYVMDLGGRSQRGIASLLLGLGMLAGCVALITVARLLERYIAGHCIRLYLRAPARPS